MTLRYWARTSYLGTTLSLSVQMFTGMCTFLELIAIFFPTLLPGDWQILVALSLTSLGSGLLLARSRPVFVHYPNGLSIRVTVGDILEESSAYYVGFTDTFGVDETEKISRNSLQGQYLYEKWEGNGAALRRAISKGLLCEHGVHGPHTLGCVSLVENPNGSRTYCVAQSKMDHQGTANASTFDITKAIEMFFEAVNSNENHGPISIPVLGQRLARVPGSTPMLMIQLTALLAHTRSSKSKFTSELCILIHPSQAQLVNLREVDQFLRALA